jgi:hypothetical protein
VKTRTSKIGKAISIAGGLVAVAGVLIVLAQAFIWLRTGNWTPIDLGVIWDFFGGPDEVGSEGVQDIVDTVLDFPLSLVVFFLGLVIIGFGALLVERIAIKK